MAHQATLPSYPTTAQQLLNTAQTHPSSSSFPSPALSPTFLALPEFAKEGELCWTTCFSWLWDLLGYFMF